MTLIANGIARAAGAVLAEWSTREASKLGQQTGQRTPPRTLALLQTL